MRPHIDDDVLRPSETGLARVVTGGGALAAPGAVLGVAEAGAGAGEVREGGGGGAGPAAGEARAHVSGAVRRVAETVDLAPVRHSMEHGPCLRSDTDL